MKDILRILRPTVSAFISDFRWMQSDSQMSSFPPTGPVLLPPSCWFGSAYGSRTRLCGLKGHRANRCTKAPYGKFYHTAYGLNSRTPVALARLRARRRLDIEDFALKKHIQQEYDLHLRTSP
jgi:hypothetical protein